MSRTQKWEYPSDTVRAGHRLRRRARPAGVVQAAFYADLADLGELDEENFDFFPAIIVGPCDYDVDPIDTELARLVALETDGHLTIVR